MATKANYTPTRVTPASTAFLLCDLQTRFREHIYSFDSVAATAGKMVKVSKILEIPIIVTEQYPRAFGPTIPELHLDKQSGLVHGPFAKTKFGMAIPEVEDLINNELSDGEPLSLVLFGIESHICVLQTALEFVERGFKVFVLADGVSSCNKEEVPIALARMRQAGALVVSSESLIYTLLDDASHPKFKEIAEIVREEKEATANVLKSLL